MTDVRVVLGIDPGLSGAIARLTSLGHLDVWDMPTLGVEVGGKARREIDLNAVRALLVEPVAGETSRLVYLEKVGVRPGEGAVGAFTFGRGFGQVEGVVAGLQMPISYVTPQAWRKANGVPPGKDGSRLRASQLMPSYAEVWRRKRDDGRAESALIALFGLLHGGRH